jgi:hypothetical protein
MKTNNTLTLIVLFALVLSACGTNAAAASSEKLSIEEAYTSAAMTFSAQSIVAASTPSPILTPVTIIPTVTLIGGIPTSTPYKTAMSSSSGTTGCDNSAYLSDVTIPDGTLLTPGKSFTKTWSLQNIGTCDWTTSYSIAHYSGSSMSGSAAALSDSVSPGGSISASVDMVAPSTAGTYTGYWRLQNASGTSFGEAVYVQIIVSSSTATVTYTPTATDEADSYTSTPTAIAPTSTTAPTSTPIPTATTEPTAPTATPAPTDAPESAVTETPSS